MEEQDILTTTHCSREYMKNWLLCKGCNDLKIDTVQQEHARKGQKAENYFVH